MVLYDISQKWSGTPKYYTTITVMKPQNKIEIIKAAQNNKYYQKS